MFVFDDDDEGYIGGRLNREKRHGTVERVDTHHYRFTADVYDSMEMLPWIRTFTGRITSLVCSNPDIFDTFYEDLEEMQKIYGGDDYAF